MTHERRRLATIAVALAALLLAIPAHAAVKWVENFGVDSPGCGTGFFTPCRTISQAIQNANPLDVILVGPGIYGDIDGDGSFSTTGDEPAEIGSGCNCLVKVNKRVTLLSRRGIGTAVIRYGVANSASIVRIDADDTIMIGFTVLGPRKSYGTLSSGIFIANSVNRVRLIRNEVEEAGEEGFLIGTGTGNVLASNRAAGNALNYSIDASSPSKGSILVSNLSSGGDLAFGIACDGCILVANRAVNSGAGGFGGPGSGVGFDVDGSANVLSRNIAAGGRKDPLAGIDATGLGFELFEPLGGPPSVSHTMVGNIAVANEGSGFKISSGSGVATRFVANTAAGNGNCGFVLSGDDTLLASNIYGNGLTNPAAVQGTTYPGLNCGLFVYSPTGTATATHNFWGASTGPGADPADVVSTAGGPANTTPFSTVPFP
jgi:hypothetical protein